MKGVKQYLGLTKRELEVLCKMAEGYTQKEIADLLFVSRYTVNSHAQHIYEKTGARSSANAVFMAYEAIHLFKMQHSDKQLN